jgi:hypothetical protein
MALRDEINNFYVDYIGRPGEAAGLDYWENVISSGQATLGDVQNLIANSAEAQGLLGGGTTTGGTTTGTTTGATTGGLLGGTQAAANNGMGYDDAVSRITSFYRSMFDRAPDAAGLKYWADLLTSGQQTWDEVSANIRRSAEAQTPQSQNAQAGIRQVPFGSQPVGGILYQTTQIPSAASMPSFQQFSNPNAVANAFQQSLAYQAALPSMIPQFNPADIPATYQQIAAPRQRLDIANVQIPDWLRIAAQKDEKRADAQTAALTGGGTTELAASPARRRAPSGAGLSAAQLGVALRRTCKRSTSFSGRHIRRRLAVRQRLLELTIGPACTAAARRFRRLSAQS